MKFGTFVPYMCLILAMVTPLTIISKLELKLGKKLYLAFLLPLGILIKILWYGLLYLKLELEEQQLTDHRKFCEELQAFCAKFDLAGQGTRQRELLKLEELEKLQQEEMTLKEGLQFTPSML